MNSNIERPLPGPESRSVCGRWTFLRACLGAAMASRSGSVVVGGAVHEASRVCSTRNLSPVVLTPPAATRPRSRDDNFESSGPRRKL
jgi:hypothetical protein